MTNDELIKANVICTDNRFEVIAKHKAELLDKTNIETSADEMAVIDNILFRMWQIGWLDRLEVQLPKECEWIEDEYGYIHCSECGMEWDEPEHPQTNFCPNCGKRMKGEKE